MRAALFILCSLFLTLFASSCGLLIASNKVPTIPAQWNATIQFTLHGRPVNGQIYQDRQNFNKTRLDAAGSGGLSGSSIYDTHKNKAFNFGHGQDCYVAALTKVEIALLTWEWLNNATACQSAEGEGDCYSYTFNKGQVMMWFKKDIPTKYQFSEGPVNFTFEVTGWFSGLQDASHFKIPSYC